MMQFWLRFQNRTAFHGLAKGLHGGGHPIDYKTTFQGLDITIENRKGSVRHWKSKDGTEGETKFEFPYGYLKRTQGLDGDHVDCFLGPNPNATHAYIITQMKRPEFRQVDEQKVMLGFDSAADAKAAYLRHYDNPRFLGSLAAMPMAEFKRKVLATKDRPTLIKALSAAERADYERETEAIRERAKTPDARRRHRFRAARWTFPNGHPRCWLCGQEQRDDGICAERSSPSTIIRKALLLVFGKAFAGHRGRPGLRGGSQPRYAPDTGGGSSQGRARAKRQRVEGLFDQLNELIKKVPMRSEQQEIWLHDEMKKHGFTNDEIGAVLGAWHALRRLGR